MVTNSLSSDAGRRVARGGAVVCAVCLVAGIGGGVPQQASAEQIDRAAENRQLLLAHFMPWYSTKPWGMHWTGPNQQHDPEQVDEQGLPDIWSHYHPLIGLYDSADPDVLECQLLQMKLAGIDGVIVDWYGISGAADYAQIHRATQQVFRSVAQCGMKFAVCFEDRTLQYLSQQGKLPAAEQQTHLTETLRWLDENWFGAPYYVRLDDRPLLLTFGPVYVEDPAVWQEATSSISPRPRFFALHHLWRKVGADGGFAWVSHQVWEGEVQRQQVMRALAREFGSISQRPEEVIAAAIPGYHDVYESGYPRVEHRAGATMQESLNAALGGQWPIVQLVTWNDYGEGTMIEPTHEFGYRFLEIVQEAVRQKPGQRLLFSAEDLRLPGDLYRLRLAGDAPRGELDRIARLLVAGEAGQARGALEKFQGAVSLGLAERHIARASDSRSLGRSNIHPASDLGTR